MKWIVVLILLNMTTVMAEGVAQDVTLKASGMSLLQAMKTIQQQTGYEFFIKSRDLGRIKIYAEISDLPIERAMGVLLQGKPAAWLLQGNTIVIKPRPYAEKAPKMVTSEVVKEVAIRRPVQQQSKVTGKVTDAIDDSSVAGVSVLVKGSTVGTWTDADGVYELSVKEQDSLIFSMVGYMPQRVKVGTSKIINVRLNKDNRELEETVVVAFGRQAKESVVSSITTVNVKDLRTPASNLTTALAGRMAGLVAYQSTGAPGEEDAQFFVRSVTSFGSGLTAPLILIDNIEMSSKDLSRLNPDDIASFSILKDASATALYGARGANGVVLVTTKEGEKGRVKTSFRHESSVSTPTTKVDMADPISYMEYANIAHMTRYGELMYPQSKIDFTRDPNRNPNVYPAVDWKDLLTRDYSVNHRTNINLTGGGNAATYYLAGSFSQDNGILKVDNKNPFNSNINLKKYSVRSNVNLYLHKTLEAKVRLSANFDDYTGPIGESGSGGANTYGKTLLANPVLFPAYYQPDYNTQYADRILFGNYSGDDFGNGAPGYINPYADIMQGYEDVRNNTLLTQLELHQDLASVTPGLKARFIGSITRYSGFNIQRSYKPFYYQYIKGTYDPTNPYPYQLSILNPEQGSDHIDYSAGNKFVEARGYAEGAVLYNRRFGGHDVGGLLVGSIKDRMDGSPSNLDSSLPSRNVALAGRFTYGYANKYFAELNFGVNGSERFDPRFRWGFFPSIGLGWQVSDEPFFQKLKPVFSKLKLRGTYGLVGNDVIVSDLDRFFFTSNINLDGPNAGYFGNNLNSTFTRPTIQILRYANPNITWEVSYKTNLALELGFFNDALSLIAEVYHENRTNIVQVRQDIPSIVGLSSSVRTNYGEAVGKGLDLTLNYNKSFYNGMWYILRGNFTYGSSKITVYDELDYSGFAPWKSVVGRKVGQSQGYVAERLFIDDNEVLNSPVQMVNGSGGVYQAGDIKYRDINGDGMINEYDIVPMGYPANPEIQYGIGGSFGFKNFDISAFIQGSSRFSFFLDANAMAPFVDVTSGGKRGNRAMLNFIKESLWTETNRNEYAQWPRLSPEAGATSIGNSNNFVRSNYWMRSASFIRLKSVEMGYKFKDVKGVSPRVYASGTNLLTLSDFKLWDPEMRGNGLAYPLQKVFNLGVQINF
ncbi:SusC/RagA family TonB-linked outer membrane protein [Sphingobacterium suaedae]|uniref:SusC/RagA family TonB-linked outer membrane protein n=1 Tax=Sphingobacterium suaedae TaxID=1686402 RepID=A0ABW5KP17_9SPHI